jgi:CDP-glycerol glycerophosphotransferase (TagB/SpsB family)
LLEGHKKIVFLVDDLSQWKLDNFLSRILKSDQYKVRIIAESLGATGFKPSILELRKFFKEKHGLDVEVVSNYGKFNHIITSRASRDEHFLKFKFVLDINKYYYTPYSFHVDNNPKMQFERLFHTFCEKIFLPSSAYDLNLKKRYNFIESGYPTETFLKKSHSQNKELKQIIWAPHHTINPTKNGLNFSTFLKFSEHLTDIKKSKDYTIYFRPHPYLKKNLISHSEWGQQKTEDYYGIWKDSGLLSTNNYINIFLESDLLITDSISFLAEWSYMNKPLIFLCNQPKQKMLEKFNALGKKLFLQANHAANQAELDLLIENYKKLKVQKIEQDQAYNFDDEINKVFKI